MPETFAITTREPEGQREQHVEPDFSWEIFPSGENYVFRLISKAGGKVVRTECIKNIGPGVFTEDELKAMVPDVDTESNMKTRARRHLDAARRRG